jgi:ATP-dependent Clp protease ATP-binding subunit ClpC
MTSNIEAKLISRGKSLGFTTSNEEERDYQNMKDILVDELKKSFNPEFLNRIDDVVIFKPLTKDDMSKILDLLLNRLSERLKNKNINIKLTNNAKAFLLDKGFDQYYGARPLQRVLQRYLEDAIAEEFVLKYNINTNSHGEKMYNVNVDLDTEKNKLRFSLESNLSNVSETL